MAKKTRTRKKTVEAAPADEVQLIPPPIPMSAVLGQGRAIATLDATLTSGRLHHAWIFHGPAGVGKMTAALAFAAVLLDPSSEPDLAGLVRPDPQSRVQTLLRAGTHPDLHVVVKELARFSDDRQIRERKLRFIPLEVVREHLLEPAALGASMSGGRASKVFIVDEAHLLNAATQNALLKTLEEPAPGTVIILVTDAEERLLPTIRSRSQRVAFGSLDDGAMNGWASKRAELAGLDPDDAEWLRRYASGSPGRLLSTVEAGLVKWHRELSPLLDMADRGVLAPALGGTMAALVEARAQQLVEGDARASKDSANKTAVQEMLGLIADRCRASLRDASRSQDVPVVERALASLEAVDRARQQVLGSVQAKFALDYLAAVLADLGSRSAEAATRRH